VQPKPSSKGAHPGALFLLVVSAMVSYCCHPIAAVCIYLHGSPTDRWRAERERIHRNWRSGAEIRYLLAASCTNLQLIAAKSGENRASIPVAIRTRNLRLRRPKAESPKPIRGQGFAATRIMRGASSGARLLAAYCSGLQYLVNPGFVFSCDKGSQEFR
jgi:hypothetical protein